MKLLWWRKEPVWHNILPPEMFFGPSLADIDKAVELGIMTVAQGEEWVKALWIIFLLCRED